MCKRNATASWSGFSHQGQVGLLVAIRKMKENGVNLAIHFLIYEKKEDVAICKRVNGAEEYLSVHQVKAYYANGDRLNSYETVLKGKVEYQRDVNGKLVKDGNNKKIPFGNPIPGDWCASDNFLHTVAAVNDWTDANVAQMGNPNNVIRYEYSQGVFNCDTVNIVALIKSELLTMLNNNPSRVDLAHLKLTYRLDEKIRSEHKKGEKALYNIEFSLQELNDLVNDDSILQASKIHEFRQAFYNEYFNRLRQNNYDEDHIQEISEKIIDKIYRLDDDEFLGFLKRLHFDENPENLDTAPFLFNPNGFRYVFFKSLLEILMVLPIYEDHYVQYSKDGVSEKFLLTAISRMPGDESQVVENILRNTDLQNILWDRHALINLNMEGSLTVLNPSIMNAGTNGEQSGKFMSFSENTRLIKVDDAKNILN
jgi:hypothetical protein